MSGQPLGRACAVMTDTVILAVRVLQTQQGIVEETWINRRMDAGQNAITAVMPLIANGAVSLAQVRPVLNALGATYTQLREHYKAD